MTEAKRRRHNCVYGREGEIPRAPLQSAPGAASPCRAAAGRIRERGGGERDGAEFSLAASQPGLRRFRRNAENSRTNPIAITP